MRSLFLMLPNYRREGVILPQPGDPGDPGGSPLPPPASLPPHLGDWTRQPGDQVLVMGNGTYDAGNFNLVQSCHAATGGTYNGWLILQAETPGGVTIDLADTGGTYRGGWWPYWDGWGNGFSHKDLRILFVGINFINGETFPAWVRMLRFYHCTFSDEPVQWNNQYRTNYHNKYGRFPVAAPLASGGTYYDDTIAGFGNPHPAAIRTAFSHLEFYFCDFLDVGDDAVESNNDLLVFRGCRWDNIFHGAVQYPTHGASTLSDNTAFHADTIQSVGGSRIVVRNCSLAGHLQIQIDASSVVMDWDNWWLYNSDGVGMALSDMDANGHFGGAGVSGHMRRGRWFANGQKTFDYTDAPHYNADYDILAYSYTAATGTDGSQFVGPPGLLWHRDSDDAVIDINTFRSLYRLFPSTVSQNGSGLLVPDNAIYPSSPYPRTPTVFDHVSNPAVVDRAVIAHSAANWLTFFNTDWVDYFSAGTGIWP